MNMVKKYSSDENYTVMSKLRFNSTKVPALGYSLVPRKTHGRHLATKTLAIALVAVFSLQFIIAIYFATPQQLNTAGPNYEGVSTYLQLDSSAILALPTDEYGNRYARFIAQGACYLYADTYDLSSPNVAEIARIIFGRETDTYEKRMDYDCFPGPNYFALGLPAEDWGEDPTQNGASIYNITIDPLYLDCFKMICIQPAILAIGSANLTLGESYSKDFIAGGPITVLFNGELMSFITLSIIIDSGTFNQIILKGSSPEETIDENCAMISQVVEGSEYLKFQIYLNPGTHSISICGEGSFFYEILNKDANFDDDYLSDVSEALVNRGSCLDILTANLYGTKREEICQISMSEYLVSPQLLWLDGEIEFRVPDSFGKFFSTMGLPLDLWIQVTQGTYTNFSIDDGNINPANTTLHGFHSTSTEEATLCYADGTEAKFPERDLTQVGDHYIGDILPGIHTLNYRVLYDPLIESEIQLFVADTGVKIVAREELVATSLDSDHDSLPNQYDKSPYSSLTYHGGSLMQLVLPVSSSGMEDLQVEFQVKGPLLANNLPTDRVMEWQPGSLNSPYVTLRYVMVLYGPGDVARKSPLDWWDYNPRGQDLWDSLEEMGSVLDMPIESHNLVMIDSFDTQHIDYGQGKIKWDGDADPLPLLGFDSAYSYFDVIYPVEANGTYLFGPLDYSRDNPAFADGALDLRVTFQVAVIETDEYNNSKSLLGLYPLPASEDVVIQSITGRFIQTANYVVAAPSSATENELFYQYCQRPDVPIASSGNNYAEGKVGMDSILLDKILGEGFDQRYLASFNYDVGKPETFGVVEAAAYAYQNAYYNLTQDFKEIPADKFPAGWDYYENDAWGSRTDAFVCHDGSHGLFDTSDVLITELYTYLHDNGVSQAEANSAVKIMPLRSGTVYFSVGVSRLTDTYNAGIISSELGTDGKPKNTPIVTISFANGFLKYKDKSLLSGHFTPGHLYKIALTWDVDANSVALAVDGNEIALTANERQLQNVLVPSQFIVRTIAPSGEGDRVCALANFNVVSSRASQVNKEACVTYLSCKERSMDFAWKLNQSILFDQSSEVFYYRGTDTFRIPSDSDFPLDWYLEGTVIGDGYAKVIDSYSGHSRVLDLFDGFASSSVTSIYRPFFDSRTSGSVEFWMNVPSDANDFSVSVGSKDIGIGFSHKLIDGKHYVYSIKGSILGTITPNRWHRIRIDFDCGANAGSGSSSIWVDSSLWLEDATFLIASRFVDRLILTTDINQNGYHVYFDKFGYDWLGYQLGSNVFGVRVREADQFMMYPGNSFSSFDPGTYVLGSSGSWTLSGASIVRNLNCHGNVLKFDEGVSPNTGTRYFDSPLSSAGTVLFWFCLPDDFDVENLAEFDVISQDGLPVVQLLVQSGVLKYANKTDEGIEYIKLCDLWGGAGNWWCVQINLNCEDNRADLFVQGVGSGSVLNVTLLHVADNIAAWRVTTLQELWFDGVEIIPLVVDLNDNSLQTMTPLSYTNVHSGDLNTQYTWSTVMDKYPQYNNLEVSQMGSSGVMYSSFYNDEMREAKFASVTGIPTRVTLKRASDSDSDRIYISDLLQIEYCIDDCMDMGDLPSLLSIYSWDGVDIPDDALLEKDLIIETTNEMSGISGICPVFLSQTFGDVERRFVDSNVLANTIGTEALEGTSYVLELFEDLVFGQPSEQETSGPRTASFSPKVAVTPNIPIPEGVKRFINLWVDRNKLLQGLIDKQVVELIKIQDEVSDWSQAMFPKTPGYLGKNKFGQQGVWVDMGGGDIQYADNSYLRLTYNVERIINDLRRASIGISRFNTLMETEVGESAQLWMPVEWNSEGWANPSAIAATWIDSMRAKYRNSFSTTDGTPDPTHWQTEDLVGIPRELITDVPPGEWNTRMPWYEGKEVYGNTKTLHYEKGCFFAYTETRVTWYLKWEIWDGFLNGKPTDESFFRGVHGGGGLEMEAAFFKRYGIPLWSTISDDGKTFLRQAVVAGKITQDQADQILLGDGYTKLTIYAPSGAVDEGWARPAAVSMDGQEMSVWYNADENKLKCEGVWYDFDYPSNLFRCCLRGYENGFNVLYSLKNAIRATKALLGFIAAGGLGNDLKDEISGSAVPKALARLMLILGYKPDKNGYVWIASHKRMAVLADDTSADYYLGAEAYEANVLLQDDCFIEKAYLDNGVADFLKQVLPPLVKANALMTLLYEGKATGEKPEYSGRGPDVLIKDPNFVVMPGTSDIALFTQFCDMLKSKGYVNYDLAQNMGRRTKILGEEGFSKCLPDELELKIRYIIASILAQYGGLELSLVRDHNKGGATFGLSYVTNDFPSLFFTVMDFPGKTQLNELLTSGEHPHAPVRNIYEAIYAYLKDFAGLDDPYVVQRLMNLDKDINDVLIVPRLNIDFFTELISLMNNEHEFRDAAGRGVNKFLWELMGMRISGSTPGGKTFFFCVERALGLPMASGESYTSDSGDPKWNLFAGKRAGRDANSYNLISGTNTPIQIEYIPATEDLPAHYVIIYKKATTAWMTEGDIKGKWAALKAWSVKYEPGDLYQQVIVPSGMDDAGYSKMLIKPTADFYGSALPTFINLSPELAGRFIRTLTPQNRNKVLARLANTNVGRLITGAQQDAAVTARDITDYASIIEDGIEGTSPYVMRFEYGAKTSAGFFHFGPVSGEITVAEFLRNIYFYDLDIVVKTGITNYVFVTNMNYVPVGPDYVLSPGERLTVAPRIKAGSGGSLATPGLLNQNIEWYEEWLGEQWGKAAKKLHAYNHFDPSKDFCLALYQEMEMKQTAPVLLDVQNVGEQIARKMEEKHITPTENSVSQAIESYLTAKFGVVDQSLSLLLTTYLMARAAVQRVEAAMQSDDDPQMFAIAGLQMSFTAIMISIRVNSFVKTIKWVASLPNVGLLACNVNEYVPILSTEMKQIGFAFLMDAVTGIFDMWTNVISLTKAGLTEQQAIQDSLIRFVPPIIFEAFVDIGVLLVSELFAYWGWGAAAATLSTSSLIGLLIGTLAGILINWAWNSFINDQNAKCTNDVNIVFDTDRQTLDYCKALATHGGLRVGDSLFYSVLWRNEGANSVWFREKTAAGPASIGDSNAAWGNSRTYTLSENILKNVVVGAIYPPEHRWGYADSNGNYLMGDYAILDSDAWWNAPIWVWQRFGDNDEALFEKSRIDCVSLPFDSNAYWVSGGWAGAKYNSWDPIEQAPDAGRYWPAASAVGYDPHNNEAGAGEYADWDYFAFDLPVMAATPVLYLHVMSQVDYVYHNYSPELGRIHGEVVTDKFPLGDMNGDGYIDPVLEHPVRVLEPTLVSFLSSCREVSIDSPWSNLDVIQDNFNDDLNSYQWNKASAAGSQLIDLARSGLFFDEDGLDAVESRLFDAAQFVGNYSYLLPKEGQASVWKSRSIPLEASRDYYILYADDLLEWRTLLGGMGTKSLYDYGWRALEPSIGTIYSQTFGSVATKDVPLDWSTVTGDPNCKVYVDNEHLVLEDNSNPYYCQSSKKFGTIFGGEITWTAKVDWDIGDSSPFSEVDWESFWPWNSEFSYRFEIGSTITGGFTKLIVIEMRWDNVAGMGKVLCNDNEIGIFSATKYTKPQAPWDLLGLFIDHWVMSDTLNFNVEVNSITRMADVYINGELRTSVPYLTSLEEFVPDSFLASTDAENGCEFTESYKGILDDFNVTCDDWAMGNLNGYGKTNPEGIILVPKTWVARQNRLLSISNEYEQYLAEMPFSTDIDVTYSWGDEIPILDPGDTYNGFISFLLNGSDVADVHYTLSGPIDWDLVSISATVPLQSLHTIPIAFTVPNAVAAGTYMIAFNITLASGLNVGRTIFYEQFAFMIRYNESLSMNFAGLPDTIDFNTKYNLGSIINTGSVPSSVLVVEDKLSPNQGTLTGDGYSPILNWGFNAPGSNFDLLSGSGVTLWKDDHIVLSATSHSIFYKNVSLGLQPGDLLTIRFKHNCHSPPSIYIGKDVYLVQFGMPDANGFYEVSTQLDNFYLINSIKIIIPEGGSVWLDFIDIDRSLSHYSTLANWAFAPGYYDPISYGWDSNFGSNSGTIEIDVPITNIGYVDIEFNGSCFDNPLESPTIKVGADNRYSIYLGIPSIPQQYRELFDFNLVERYLYLRPHEVPVDSINEDLRVYECGVVDESTLCGLTIPKGDPAYWWLINASLPTDRTEWWSWCITYAREDYLCINTTSTSEWSFFSDANGGDNLPFVKYIFRKSGVRDQEMIVQSTSVSGEKFNLSSEFSEGLENITLFKGDKIWVGYESNLSMPLTLTLNNSQVEFENQTFILYPSSGYTLVELNIEPEFMNVTSLHIEGIIKYGEFFGFRYISIFRYQPVGNPFLVKSVNGFFNQTIDWTDVQGYTPMAGGIFTFDGTWSGFQPSFYGSAISYVETLSPVTTAIAVDSTRPSQNLQGEPLIVSLDNSGARNNVYFGMPTSLFLSVSGSTESIRFGVDSDTSTIPLGLLTTTQYDTDTISWINAPRRVFSGSVDPILPIWSMSENISAGHYYTLDQSAIGSTVLKGPTALYRYPKIGVDSMGIVFQTDVAEKLTSSLSDPLDFVIGSDTRIRARFNNTKLSNSLSIIFETNIGQREWLLANTATGGFREAVYSFNADDLQGGEIVLQNIIIRADLGAQGRSILDYIIVENSASVTPVGILQGHRDVIALQGSEGYISSINLTFEPSALGEFDFWIYSPGTNGSICITFDGQTEGSIGSLNTISLDLAQWTLSIANNTQFASFPSYLAGWYQFSVCWNTPWHNFTISCYNKTFDGIWNCSNLIDMISGVRFGTVDGQRAFLIDALASSSDSDFISMGNLNPTSYNGTGYSITLNPGDVYDLNYISPPRSWTSAPGTNEIFVSLYATSGNLIGTYNSRFFVPVFHDQRFTNTSVVDFVVPPRDVGEEPNFVCFLYLQNLGNTEGTFSLSLEGILAGATYAFSGDGVVDNSVTLIPGELVDLRLEVLKIGYQTHIFYITATETGQASTRIPCFMCTNYPIELLNKPVGDLAYTLGDPDPQLLSWTLRDGSVTPELATFSICLNGLEIVNETWLPDPMTDEFTYSIDVSGLPVIGSYKYALTITDGRRSIVTDEAFVVVFNDLPQVSPIDSYLYIECNRTAPVTLDWNIYDLQAVGPLYNITIDEEAYITEMPWVWDDISQKGTISLNVAAFNLPPRDLPYNINLTVWDGDVSTSSSDAVDVFIYNERPVINCIYDNPVIYSEWGDYFVIAWTFADDSYGEVPAYRIYLDGELIQEAYLPAFGSYGSGGASYATWTQDLGLVNRWYTFRFEFDDGLGFNSTSTSEIKLWVGNPPPKISVDNAYIQFEFNANPEAYIKWTPSDTYVFGPTYCVYVDAGDGAGFILFSGAPYHGDGEGSWSSGTPITIDVSGLDLGTYTFALEVSDGFGERILKEDMQTWIIVDVYNIAPQFTTEPDDLIECTFGQVVDSFISWQIFDLSMVQGNWEILKNGVISILSGTMAAGSYPVDITVSALNIEITDMDPYSAYTDFAIILHVEDNLGLVADSVCTLRVWNLAPCIISSPGDRKVWDGASVTLTWEIQDTSVIAGRSYWKISRIGGSVVADEYWIGGDCFPTITITNILSDNPYTPKDCAYELVIYDGFVGGKFPDGSIYHDIAFSSTVTITVKGDNFDSSKAGWGNIKYQGQGLLGGECSGIAYLSGSHLCQEVGPHGYNRGYASIYYTNTPVSHSYGNWFGILTETDYSSGYLDYTALGIELGALSGSTDIKRYLSFMVGYDTGGQFVTLDSLTESGARTNYAKRYISANTHVWLYMKAYYDTANEIRSIGCYYSTDGSSWTLLTTLGYWYWCAPVYTQYIGLSTIDWDGWALASHFTGKFDLFATFKDSYGGFPW